MMAPKYYNEGWFGNHPHIYDFMNHFVGFLRRRAAKQMSSAQLKVLDIATGTGAHAVELARLRHDVTGIDLDESMLATARRKISAGLRLSFSHGDGSDTGFPDDRFDAVTISFAMHDVPYEVGLGLLSEAKRVVKDDGFLFIIDYNDLSGFGSKVLHPFAWLYESPNYRAFVKRGLPQYLHEAGWRMEHKSTFLGAVQFVKAVPQPG